MRNSEARTTFQGFLGESKEEGLYAHVGPAWMQAALGRGVALGEISLLGCCTPQRGLTVEE